RARRWLSVTHACCLFQMMGGSIQTTKAPRSEYRPGRLNSGRNRGAKASTRRMEINSRPFVYLQRNPRPIRKPVTVQYHEGCGLRSRASQNANIAAVQKKMESGSIVIKNAPMLKIGVTFNAITSHSPALALIKRWVR